ncbi:hypothetical protein [Oceanobacillus salinisoli]|uniref:hypothetical protein n=1 Tax=Oceanobacillus salinisoli TaxID=2678611 RepID=UPI0012E21275|nr:hypothetical protein [Oceanobacillus salinisoli]
MRSPTEKITLIEILSIAIAGFFGLLAMVQGYLTLMLLTFYLVCVSLICDALIYWQKGHTAHTGKQVLRAAVIFIFTTYILIRL